MPSNFDTQVRFLCNMYALVICIVLLLGNIMQVEGAQTNPFWACICIVCC